MAGPTQRVFLSHTAELRDFPSDRSFVAAAEAAVLRADYAVADMEYFTAQDRSPSAYVREMIQGCDVYVGLIGFRYGAPVRDHPETSYSELEYDTATEARLPRLVFMLGEHTKGPRSLFDDPQSDRQMAFRDRLREAGVVKYVTTPDEVELGLFQALVELRSASERPAADEGAERADLSSAHAMEAGTGESLGGGYNADEADDSDLSDALGFNADVKMICSVLADKKARPPLSVGLFGEWGSGKSFFMRLMRQRIVELAAAAYEAEQDNHETRYCSHVVQVVFNAWHYMDANLWASLAVEIFNQLATPPPPGRRAPTSVERERSRVQEERKNVLVRLDTYQRLVAELTEARQRAEQERERAQQQLAEAVAQRESIAHDLAVVVSEDIAAELDKDPDLTKLRQKAAETLGLPEIPSQELPLLVRDIGRLSGQIALVWRLLAKRKGTWVFWLATIFVIALLAGLVLLATTGVRTYGAAAVGVALAAMAGLAARVRPVLNAVNDGLGMAASALRRSEKLEQEFRARQTEKQVELESQLSGLVAQEQSLAAQLAEATGKVAEARVEEEDLRAGRRLQRFLQERSGSTDYRSHLGLISLLRQDFQQLSTLLQMAVDEQDKNGEKREKKKKRDGQLPRIDRIILYVDDLDRCPPSCVVEVLQAIHLLLALPLFVVVVGVDPRWLLRSLEHQYRALMTPSAGGDATPSDVSHWASTPQNYLEKIFQIPFALAHMTGPGFAQLVEDLAIDRGGDPSGYRQDAGSHATGSSGPAGGSASTQTGEGRRTFLIEEGSAASSDESIDPNPIGLSMTPGEIDFIQALAPLVTTPRAGKRLVNIYRMIRSTQAIGSSSRFLNTETGSGGDYRAVLQLLAIVSGFPELAAPVFAKLETEPSTSWTKFVDTLPPVAPPSLDGSDEHLNDSQAAAWSRLQAGLVAVRNEVDIPDELRPYREWAPRIARFSFAAGWLLGEAATPSPHPRDKRHTDSAKPTVKGDRRSSRVARQRP